MEISGHRIGDGAPCFVIAEAGINHNGDLDKAVALIDAAVSAGCQAVKFQTFDVRHLLAPKTPMVAYQQQNTGTSQTQAEMLRSCQLDAAAHRQLIQYCREQGIVFLSTPFDDGSLELLLELNVPAIKISSGDLTNLPFLAKTSATGRPLLLSTGMGTMEEVKAAADAIRAGGNSPFLALHCVSNYPASPEESNLRSMQSIRNELQVPVGFSDHTLGFDVTLAAVALGANCIEKHITLDCSLPGPDHKASLEHGELKQMVAAIRRVEQALGNGIKQPTPAEKETARLARKSIHTARNILQGEVLDVGSLCVKRPGTGFSPALLGTLLGRTAAQNIPADTLLESDMLDS